MTFLPSRRHWAVHGVALLCLLCRAYGLDPDRSLLQYVREHWDTESKSPGGAVNGITQTRDGYLWVGTDKGLFRFDGFNFTPVSFSPVADASKVPVLDVLTDADGSLWIRVQGSDVLHEENGKFETVVFEAGPPSRQVTAVSKDRSGAVLLSDVVAGTFRFNGKDAEQLAVPTMLPGSSPVISIAETSEGKIWLGTLGAGLFRLEEGNLTPLNAGLPERKINCLLPIGDDDLWVGTDNGLYHWSGKEFRREPLPSSLNNVQVLSLLRDRHANVWVGTARGLLRINAKGVSVAQEELRQSTPGAINALFEDREGNLWVGGARGLERMRDTVFVSFSAAADSRFERTGPIYVDPQGGGWFAPGAGGLYTIHDDRIEPVSAIPRNDVVYSIAGRADEVWVGRQRGGLSHLQWRNGAITSRTYAEADGLAQNSVYTVMIGRDGTVWAGTVSGGVSRLRDGKFTTYTAANGLAANAVFSILETRDGTVWFATSNGVSSLSNDRWKTYGTAQGLPSANANCLFEDSTGTLWSGTSAGLAIFAGGRFQAPSLPEILREPIFAIAEDAHRWFWITTSAHVLQVPRDKLVSNKIGQGELREYGPADGLPSSEGVHRSRSMFQDSGGRIWISVKGGLAIVNPSQIAESWPPALPHIQSVTADGVTINPAKSLRVPPSHKRITLAYTGLSLAVPERVRFKYFLEGFDRQWSEPTAAREAVYTNLGPGTYRFHLVAGNSYGEWNGAENALEFEVDPAFWQTWWFRMSLLLIAASIALVSYRVHLRRVTNELNMRFEERLAERTRIAQELHDTLLQGFVSASMQLHVADDHVPADSPAKPLLTRILGLMSQVIEEGRTAVRGLRSSSGPSYDLGQAFSRVPQELGIQEEIEFRVIVEGTPQLLHPVIRDEVYRIGRESLANAFRHSGGDKVEVELEYSSNGLHILVRDNGCGIDPQVLAAGRDGHWGLAGMRERAEKIGAKLKVWSRAAAGTEVELSIPGHIAFQSYASSHPATWLARLYPRGRVSETERTESKEK